MTHLLPETEYKNQVKRLLDATYAAIEEALGYIERQEDGPITMCHALKDIQASLESVERETDVLTSTIDNFQTLAIRLTDQRDEAVRQRDLLLRIIGFKQ